MNSDTGKPVLVDDSRLTAAEFEKVKIAETIETRGEKSCRPLHGPLWQADSDKIRRMAPIEFIGRYMPEWFDYAICDEVPSFRTMASWKPLPRWNPRTTPAPRRTPPARCAATGTPSRASSTFAFTCSMALWKMLFGSGIRVFGQSRYRIRTRSQRDHPTTLHALLWTSLPLVTDFPVSVRIIFTSCSR